MTITQLEHIGQRVVRHIIAEHQRTFAPRRKLATQTEYFETIAVSRLAWFAAVNERASPSNARLPYQRTFRSRIRVLSRKIQSRGCLVLGNIAFEMRIDKPGILPGPLRKCQDTTGACCRGLEPFGLSRGMWESRWNCFCGHGAGKETDGLGA